MIFYIRSLLTMTITFAIFGAKLQQIIIFIPKMRVFEQNNVNDALGKN